MTSVIQSGCTISTPSTAPTAVVGTAAGLLTAAAVYQYKVTFVTAFGETDAYVTAASVTASSTGSVNLSSIPISHDSGVYNRKLYRTVGNGTAFLLLATIDNIVTTYTDIVVDASLGAALAAFNGAHSRQIINGFIKHALPLAHSLEDTITATVGGGQTNARALVSEYNFVTVVASIADSVKLPVLDTTVIGMHVLVANDGANSVNIYPSLGQNASGGTNVAVALAAAGRAEFVGRSATVWEKTR